MNCTDCPYKSCEDKKCPCAEKTVRDIVRIGNRSELRERTDINLFLKYHRRKRFRKSRRD